MSVLCPPPSAVILAFEVFRTLTESLQTLPVFLFFNSLVPYRQSNFFLAVFTSGVRRHIRFTPWCSERSWNQINHYTFPHKYYRWSLSDPVFPLKSEYWTTESQIKSPLLQMVVMLWTEGRDEDWTRVSLSPSRLKAKGSEVFMPCSCRQAVSVLSLLHLLPGRRAKCGEAPETWRLLTESLWLAAHPAFPPYWLRGCTWRSRQTRCPASSLPCWSKRHARSPQLCGLHLFIYFFFALVFFFF